jgi:hypothetical protein
LLPRLTFDVPAVFRIYCRKPAVAKLASNQFADLGELLALLKIKLVEFGHCSNPSLLAAASRPPLELPPHQNNDGGPWVPGAQQSTFKKDG